MGISDLFVSYNQVQAPSYLESPQVEYTPIGEELTTQENLDRIQSRNQKKEGFAAFHADGLVDILQTLIMQNDLGYIDIKNKKITFANDKMVEIYKWYADMCAKGYFEFNTIGQYSSDDLSNGDIAIFSGQCAETDQTVVRQKV